MKTNWWIIAGTAIGLGALMGVMPKGSRTDSVFTLPGTKREFIERMLNALSSIAGLSIQTKMLITAHAAYESGWGSATAAKYFNVFNVTAGKAWLEAGKPVIIGGDKEYRPDGSVVNIQQRFRAYGSLAEACRDYLNSFLRFDRYQEARAQLMAGDAGFVVTLGGAGYYTLPVQEYWSTYASVLRRVYNTTQEVLAVAVQPPTNYQPA